MNIEIAAEPKFWIELSRAQVLVLVKCSTHHYDMVCKSSSQLGGFLYGWHNHILFATENEADSPDPVKVCGSFRQLDTCLKIMENITILQEQSERELAVEIRVWFRKALHKANNEMPSIHFKVE